MEVINKLVTLKAHMDGSPQESDFVIKTETLSLSAVLESKDVLVKNIYVSIDPYQINRMKSLCSSQTASGSSYAAGIAPGQAIDTHGVGRVVVSGNPDFKKDDLVVGRIGWGEYSIVKEGANLDKLNPLGFPYSYHVGILGVSGFTAYAGFYEICQPKKGERVFVSAAAGSVGNIVGQYAKLFGCYVVGCAGSQEKVDLLKNKLGFDDAFNYKEETDLKAAVAKYFPDGEMLEAAVANMNQFGRVAVCGVIAEYTEKGKRAAPDMIDIVYKRITIRGFLAGDYMSQFPEFISATSDHLKTGRMHSIEDISQGLESIPSAFAGLFRGDNVGKKIVQIADE
ncbi:hypothetical protein DCAR_0310390 [Daucus carota subsp. sativus]|uniref:Enoyl reductase (ER) domain-containing protein n=1 Tax=Daucus carota subsp. sativus TaxID=79200 RepID=A0AAF1ASB8_DAUCS|nr:hypothetical protein DCAR_0310390 [Daucus carota subsp. sativus]